MKKNGIANPVTPTVTNYIEGVNDVPHFHQWGQWHSAGSMVVKLDRGLNSHDKIVTRLYRTCLECSSINTVVV